jgi:pimeloyl-ACP methyl ester carboxylesterase
MAMIRVNGTSVYYEDTAGGGPPILFSHGLLWNTALFAPQIAALRDRYRCIAYDHRGQGNSEDTVESSISMDTLTADAAALIKTLRLAPVHFCGLSMGGFVGLRLAVRHPDLVRSLILMETSADPETFGNKIKYRALNIVARLLGPKLIANAVMPIFFGKTVLSDTQRAAERSAWKKQLVSNRRSIWRAVNGIIEREGVYDLLAQIAVPTLVIVGDEDVATAPAKALRIAQAIKGASLVRIPGAGHSATVEQPQSVTAAIAAFIADVQNRI